MNMQQPHNHTDMNTEKKLWLHKDLFCNQALLHGKQEASPIKRERSSHTREKNVRKQAIFSHNRAISSSKRDVPYGYGGNSSSKRDVPSGYGEISSSKRGVPSGYGEISSSKRGVPSGYGGNSFSKRDVPFSYKESSSTNKETPCNKREMSSHHREITSEKQEALVGRGVLFEHTDALQGTLLDLLIILIKPRFKKKGTELNMVAPFLVNEQKRNKRVKKENKN